MKKKVLFTYASYGSGHKSAAYNIMNYFMNQKNEYELKIIDFSDYRSKFGAFNEHLFNLNFQLKSSIIYTTSYILSNNSAVTIPYKRTANSLFKVDILKQIIKEYDPDITISTYFFCSTIISELNEQNVIHSKLITVLTDYTPHELWLKDFKHEDALIVSNEYLKNQLVTKGLDKRKIYSFGIPLSYNFKSNVRSKDKTFRMYNLEDDCPTFLFFGGGSLGSMYTYNYFKKIIDTKINAQFIFVAGKNKKLKEKCESYLIKTKTNNIKVIGYTSDVINLLNISDAIITKPGGLTLTECLEMKKPVLLIKGNGANEIYNDRFVCKKGYGIRCHSSRKLCIALKNIINKPNTLIKLNKNLQNYEDNISSKKIYNLTNKILKNK